MLSIYMLSKYFLVLALVHGTEYTAHELLTSKTLTSYESPPSCGMRACVVLSPSVPFYRPDLAVLFISEQECGVKIKMERRLWLLSKGIYLPLPAASAS